MTHRDEYVEFVTPRLGRLRALAYQLSGDWHGADDLVQITLTKTLLNWRRVREATDIDMYVRAILVKAFLTERTLGWSRVRLLAAIPERPAPPSWAVAWARRRLRGRGLGCSGFGGREPEGPLDAATAGRAGGGDEQRGNGTA